MCIEPICRFFWQLPDRDYQRPASPQGALVQGPVKRPIFSLFAHSVRAKSPCVVKQHWSYYLTAGAWAKGPPKRPSDLRKGDLG